MGSLKPALHGRDHLPGGEDPIRFAADWVYVGTYPGDPHTTADSPPFLNGYSNPAGIQPLRFRLTIEGSIEIEGFATGGTPGLKVFTLPASYADGLDDTELRIISSDLFTPAAWRIETNGDVYLESETLPTGGLEYVYSTSTLSIADGLPGVSGAGDNRVWFDQATDLTTITKLRISHFDAGSNDLSVLLSRWDDSTTATNRGYIMIRWIHDPSQEVRFLLFEITGDVTDEGLWDEFPINFVELDRYALNWPDGTPVAIFFFRTGDKGSTGTTGATGTAGADGGIAYTYKTDTGLTDPASGNLKFDTVTLGSVTNLRISHTDGPGADITALLATWDDSTTLTNRGQVFVQKTSDPSAFIAFDISGAITDHTTWDDVAITAVASHGTFGDGDAVRVFFARTGDIGAAGATGAAGTNGATWYSGAGAPSGGTGVNGDFYLNTSTGDVYKKSSGAWGSPIENITGPTGATGATGPSSIATPGSDLTATGITRDFTAGESLAFGDPVYIKSDGNAWKAKAGIAGTFPAIGVATAAVAGGATVTVLLLGVARNDAWTWTVGGIVYAAATGGLTQTQPSATDNAIDVVGIAEAATRVYVNAQLVYLTHV